MSRHFVAGQCSGCIHTILSPAGVFSGIFIPTVKSQTVRQDLAAEGVRDHFPCDMIHGSANVFYKLR